MAVSLTEEMRTAINNAFTDGFPIIWATTGADGQPVLGFFGTTQAYSDHEIGIWMRTPARGFLSRIAENPKATMLYRNTKTRMAFQIHVEARRVDDEAAKQTIWSNAAEFERNQDLEMKGTAVVAEIVRVIQRGEVIMERD
ncbi:MAG: pyridoxamine 5'-phosphate oxidase family protein [Dehalococcoidia bacterium]|nr:pyridoxamine 5'-phosphate oxidase family protein [Dehalococcoidia bacterium]